MNGPICHSVGMLVLASTSTTSVHGLYLIISTKFVTLCTRILHGLKHLVLDSSTGEYILSVCILLISQ